MVPSLGEQGSDPANQVISPGPELPEVNARLQHKQIPQADVILHGARLCTSPNSAQTGPASKSPDRPPHGRTWNTLRSGKQSQTQEVMYPTTLFLSNVQNRELLNDPACGFRRGDEMQE